MTDTYASGMGSHTTSTVTCLYRRAGVAPSATAGHPSAIWQWTTITGQVRLGASSVLRAIGSSAGSVMILPGSDKPLAIW